MTDEVDRIRGLGIPMRLIDGTETTIRFGMLGTRQLTKKYGSLNNLQKIINNTLGKAAQSENEQDITDEGMELLLTLRAAGFSHLGLNEYELEDQLAHIGLMEQMSLIFDAFTEGLGGEPDKEESGPKDHRAKGGKSRSPSRNSGPSAQLTAVGQTSSSGG